MKTLKEGDIVICISEDRDVEDIKIGGLYTVTGAHGDHINFQDDADDRRFRPSYYYQIFSIEIGKETIKEKQEQIKMINAEINLLDANVKILEERNKIHRGDRFLENDLGKTYTVTSFFIGDTLYHMLVSNEGTVWRNPEIDINDIFGYGSRKNFTKL